MTTTIYKNNSFELTSDTFLEGSKKGYVSDGILTTADGITINAEVPETVPNLSSDCPMLDVMYGIAILDHENLKKEEKN